VDQQRTVEGASRLDRDLQHGILLGSGGVMEPADDQISAVAR